jgi:hypothetical protein
MRPYRLESSDTFKRRIEIKKLVRQMLFCNNTHGYNGSKNQKTKKIFF